MAERILVSTEKILETMSKYNAEKGNLSVAISQMNDAVNTLDGFWNGPASDVFMSAFRALHANLQTSDQHMQDAVNELKQAADIFAQADTDIGSKSGQLEAGNPFELS